MHPYEKKLVDISISNKDVVVITAENRFCLRNIPQLLGKRFIDVGIAEEHAITYAAGGFTVGYQYSEEDLGRSASEQQYENTGYGITFNVNDDLSVGYNHTESDESGQSLASPEADSLQASYTMGGATFSIAEVNVDNAGYSTASSADSSDIDGIYNFI